MRVDEPRTRTPVLSRRALTTLSRRVAPTLLALALAAAYVAVAPPSSDLAAQLLRVKLFGAEGFGLWDNWWYAGHNVLGYSVLFPPLAWLIGPRLLGGLAAVASAAAFEALAREQFGQDAWLGSLGFGAATVTSLLSGRLTFAFGLLGAILTALALQRGRPRAAAAAAVLTALASPVAALFAALAGAADALGARTEAHPIRRAFPGGLVVLAALGPIAILAVAFPEGGHEPFAFSALWPIPVVGAALYAGTPKAHRRIRIAILLYTVGALAAYLIPTPVGGNAARLGALVAAPLAALLWWPTPGRAHRPHRRRRLLLAALPLLYLQWQAAVRDPVAATRDPSTQAGYYRPLLTYLRSRADPPFRIEIPLTAEHWEAYEVAPYFPLARGWERQLDERDNPLFYSPGLTENRYDDWLHRLAIRFVALPDTKLDASARPEAKLIRAGLPDLQSPVSAGHWRIYAVRNPTPIVTGAATLTALGPDSASLIARRPGHAVIRVRFSPYWKLTGVPGCVAPAGAFTQVELDHPGRARLVIGFSPTRIGARSPRCTPRATRST